jgi:hypothetical protein
MLPSTRTLTRYLGQNLNYVPQQEKVTAVMGPVPTLVRFRPHEEFKCSTGHDFAVPNPCTIERFAVRSGDRTGQRNIRGPKLINAPHCPTSIPEEMGFSIHPTDTLLDNPFHQGNVLFFMKSLGNSPNCSLNKVRKCFTS